MQRNSRGVEPAAGTAREPLARRVRRLAGRIGAPVLLHALFVGLVAGLALWRPAALEDRVEGPLIDWRFRARDAWMRFRTGGPHAPPSGHADIVIVTLDEAGARATDSRNVWRSRMYTLMNRIAPEPQEEPKDLDKPRALGIDLPDSPWDSGWISGALKALPGKIAATALLHVGAPADDEAPEQLLAGAIARVDRPERLHPPEASHAQLPPGDISQGLAFGHSFRETGGDGKLRRERLYVRYGDALIPSLALQTARLAAGLQPGAVRVRGDGAIEFGEIGKGGRVIPTDRRGRLLVNYYDDDGDGRGPLKRLGEASLVAGKTKLRDAVVFVGMPGTPDGDSIGTPFSRGVPAVERHAVVAANILAGDFLRDAPPAADLLVVLAAGLAVPLLLRRRAALSLLCLLGTVLALVAANLALFTGGTRLALALPLFAGGTRLALALPLFVLLAAGGVAVVRQHLAEASGERRVRRLFSSYVTERVVERLIADPTLARPGGERREVTILFADIRGFTGFAERTPPEEVVRTLNEYLEAMTEVVFRWEGTLDKFIGDTILAFWGAPLPQEDHAERALRCSLNLCARLDRLNAEWVAAGRQPLEIGIGVTTGMVLVGNIGAEGKKMDYTVIGDQVNICSRVEELTKDFAARILVTGGTFERLRPAFAAAAFGHVTVESLAPVPVKGKQERVRVYRVSPQRHGAPTHVAGFAAPVHAPGA